MNHPRNARRLVALCEAHRQIVATAHGRGHVTDAARDLIDASALDVLHAARLVDAGERLAQAAQRATDPTYLNGLLTEYAAWAHELEAA